MSITPSSIKTKSLRVNPSIDRAAAYSWRILVIAAMVSLVAIIFYQLRVVTVPLFIALLATTVLLPPVRFLEEKGFKPGLATATVFLCVAAFLVGFIYVLASPVTDEFRDLGPQVSHAIDDINDWLINGPLHLQQAQLDHYIDEVGEQLRDNTGALQTGVVTSATLAAEVFTGFILSIILTFFFVKDGQRLVEGISNRFPAHHRPVLLAAGLRAYKTLGGYLRGVAATGVVDAACIGIALFILDVPLLFPLVVLTFLGAFFPVVGATLAGAVAAAVALVNGGAVDMLIVIAVVLAVQQLEGHLLQPLLVGRAVSLHPVVILVALGSGAIIAGLLGAFIAVPIVAVIGSIIKELDIRHELATSTPIEEM